MNNSFKRVRGVLGMEHPLMQPDMDDVDALTEASREGDPLATERLWSMCQEELHSISRSLLRNEHRTESMQTTVLVNEAFVRMYQSEPPQTWESQSQFFAFVWRVMKNYLVDYARQRRSLKRGGDRRRVPFEIAADGLADLGSVGDNIGPLLEALDRLQAVSPREHEVLWRRFALGETHGEVARAMGISRTTVTEDWRSSRAWLIAEMNRSTTDPEGSS